MRPIWKFRLLVLLIVAIGGGVSISNLAAEIVRPGRIAFPSTPDLAASEEQVSSAKYAATIAPFRSDLKADYALALTGQAIRYDREAQASDAAKEAIRSALNIGPHDAKTWLALALLQSHGNPSHPLVAESLKMSYLTGPSRAELIAPRLEITTAGDSLKDADLSELARSDVRAILTRSSAQRQLLSNDYVRASAIGKTFLEDSAKMIDPAFASTLKGVK